MFIIALLPIVVCIWVALKKKYSFLTSVQLSCIGCALFVLIYLGAIYLATGMDIVTYNLSQIKQYLQQNESSARALYIMLQSMAGNAANAQVSLNEAVNAVYQQFANMAAYSAAAMISVFIPVGGLVLYLIARAIVKLAGAQVVPVPAFADFKLPSKFGRWSIVILLVFWIGQMANWRNFDIVFISGLALFGSIYFILGMAFIEWWLKRSIKSPVARFFIIAVIAVLFFSLYLFVFIGLFEQIVKIRQRASMDKGSI